MKSEFEEKRFEQHLSFELLSTKNMFDPPGQVLENILGFDVALFTVDRQFWKLFSKSRSGRKTVVVKPGVKLENKWWKKLDQNLQNFPPFKFNLFIQYKRPYYLTKPNSREWPFWKGDYYRYEVVAHQQRALERLEDKIKDKGIVVYASPAFWTLNELWNAIANFKLIANTNFVRASKLQGHKAYTYQEPGKKGRAYSDPEDIEPFDFLGHLKSFSRKRARSTNNRAFLIEIGQIVDQVMAKEDTFSWLYNEITSSLSKRIDKEAAIALIKVNVFCFLKGTTWKIGI